MSDEFLIGLLRSLIIVKSKILTSHKPPTVYSLAIQMIDNFAASFWLFNILQKKRMLKYTS